ncbi:uncharacterized protein LOC124953451 [Vespa velutina]|uniref:uncharacterized protein LOC124953451 n=1 Tax=Vespa velutina TaxID=202808 RepID=UPI001FB5313A|nr:uncharacterized protein LOC124953451 [Vespa velutina]
MNNPDLSQLSDISTISRISLSSRLMGKLDSILLSNELEDHFSFIENSKGTTSTDQDINDLKDITKLFITCQNSISDYAKAKLIFECIKELCSNKNSTLSEETIEKLKELLESYEINKIKNLSITFKHTLQDLTILGIQDFPDIKLSYEEKLNIKASVEALMHEKIHNYMIKYEELGGNLKELQKLNGFNANNYLQENTDFEILKWIDKFEDICGEYKNYVSQYMDMMNEWRKLKDTDINEVYNKKAQILLLKSEVIEVQTNVAKISCLTKMYTETPKTIDSYRILNKILDDKLLEISKEIKRKKSLEKLYRDLENTEYDNILETYLHLCSAIKKKKQIMEML